MLALTSSAGDFQDALICNLTHISSGASIDHSPDDFAAESMRNPNFGLCIEILRVWKCYSFLKVSLTLSK